jgi:hypothetical protein
MTLGPRRANAPYRKYGEDARCSAEGSATGFVRPVRPETLQHAPHKCQPHTATRVASGIEDDLKVTE